MGGFAHNGGCHPWKPKIQKADVYSLISQMFSGWLSVFWITYNENRHILSTIYHQQYTIKYWIERSKHTSIMVGMEQKDSYIGNKTQ